MCLWALYHVLTWKWSNTLSILQWLNIFVLFGRLQCQISLYPSSDLHVLITSFRKGTILSIWLYWKFTQSLERSGFFFPGKISIDACLSRIPLDTAICSNNRHVFSRRSHGTRAASWLIISWLSYLKCLQNTALWLGRVHIKHFFSWKVSGQRARKDISKTWPWSRAIPPIELTQLWDKESCRR